MEGYSDEPQLPVGITPIKALRTLTIREAQVLFWRFNNEKNSGVALRMKLSVGTVEGEMRSIYAKLGFGDKSIYQTERERRLFKYYQKDFLRLIANDPKQIPEIFGVQTEEEKPVEVEKKAVKAEESVKAQPEEVKAETEPEPKPVKAEPKGIKAFTFNIWFVLALAILATFLGAALWSVLLPIIHPPQVIAATPTPAKTPAISPTLLPASPLSVSTSTETPMPSNTPLPSDTPEPTATIPSTTPTSVKIGEECPEIIGLKCPLFRDIRVQ